MSGDNVLTNVNCVCIIRGEDKLSHHPVRPKRVPQSTIYTRTSIAILCTLCPLILQRLRWKSRRGQPGKSLPPLRRPPRVAHFPCERPNLCANQHSGTNRSPPSRTAPRREPPKAGRGVSASELKITQQGGDGRTHVRGVSAFLDHLKLEVHATRMCQ